MIMNINMRFILMLVTLNQMYGLGNNNNITDSTNKTIATNKTSPPNFNNGTGYCVDLPIYGDNKTFCGIKNGWTPRLSNETGILILILISAIGWIATVIGVLKTKTFMYNVYESKKVLDYLAVNTIAGCLPVSSKTAAMKIMITFYGKLIWDAIDVTFDVILFYDFEKGDLIDSNIARNSVVMWCILAFAIFGACKIFLMIIWFQSPIGVFENESKEHVHFILNTVFLVFTFLFEDGPELVLEYFFVEKFISNQPPWYQLVKDIIMALVAVYFVVDMVWNGIKMFKAGSYKYFGLFLMPIAITVVMVLRAVAAVYQYVTGKLNRNCLDIQDGMLVQTPFATGCLKEIDYAIIAVLFVILVTLVIFVINLNYLHLPQQFNPNKDDFDSLYFSKKNRLYYQKQDEEKLKIKRKERRLIKDTKKIKMLREKYHDEYLEETKKLWAKDNESLKKMKEIIENDSKQIKAFEEENLKREDFKGVEYNYDYDKEVYEQRKRKVRILKEFLALILVDNDKFDLVENIAKLQQEKDQIKEIKEIDNEDRNHNDHDMLLGPLGHTEFIDQIDGSIVV
uniref:Uncharacterized protein n=1 Tax=Clytia hemisphaerica TaxID=252671 RepID=A0A7M6DQY4_9CNID|eukprot:TCONS_00039236-protein